MISRTTGVSIFFPCYNDQKSIGILIEKADTIIKKFTTRYEIIVIDDCSTDSSRKILLKLLAKYRKLRLIFHEQNKGYGGALISGFKKAKYEWVFYTDGDGQYDIKELPILLSLTSKDVDFVNGIKMSRHDPTYRIVVGNIYSFVTRWLFWIPVYDIDCDFRLIRTDFVKKLNLTCSSGAICIELVKKAQLAGATFRQVSIHHIERKFGISQFFRAERIVKTLQEVVHLWVQLMVLRHPLKILKRLQLQLNIRANYNPLHVSQK